MRPAPIRTLAFAAPRSALTAPIEDDVGLARARQLVHRMGGDAGIATGADGEQEYWLSYPSSPA